jgi:hypothetical protein
VLAVPAVTSLALAAPRQDAGCVAGANHVTAASTTNDMKVADDGLKMQYNAP